MAEIDIAEQICLAIDQIVNERIKSIKYDTTIVATIVDNIEANKNKYICSNGSADFIAYSKDTSFKIGESVQVTIPNNDYDQQKIIVGRCVTKEEKPLGFIYPFDTIVDVSANLITGNDETISASLLANDDYYTDPSVDKTEKFLWYKAFLNGAESSFTRLGIQGQFRSWLAALNTVSGNYGYRVEIISTNKNRINSDSEKITLQWIDAYGKILNGNLIDKEILCENTPDDWFSIVATRLNNNTFNKDYFKNIENISLLKNCIYLMLSVNAQISELELDSSDMYGNPYNFQSFFTQEKVYDISSFGDILGIYLFFYQKTGSFFNKDHQLIEYREFVAGQETGGKLLPNLFTKDPYICLGYDLASFSEEQAILYCLDGTTYIIDDKIDKNLNKKNIRLRWLHEFEDGSIKVISEASDIQDYEIRWYRYKLGAPSADEYSGVYWKKIDNGTKNFSYILEPAVNNGAIKPVEFERIKVIVLYNGKVIRSNILEFSSEKEVPNDATTELLAGLSLICKDNSYGNYFLYGQNNNLLDTTKSNEILDLVAYFATAEEISKNILPELTEATKITWEFPLNNSMLILHGFDYINKTILSGYFQNAKVNITNDKIIIEKNHNGNYKIDNLLSYRIGRTYSANKTNNTVKCIIEKNNITYTAIKDFSFGLMGTNGTDATVVIDFEDNETALLVDGENNSLKVIAHLYGPDHKEIDFNDIGLKLTCDWSWYEAWYNESPFEEIDNHRLKIYDLLDSEGHKILNGAELKFEKADFNINNIPFYIIKVVIKGFGDYDLEAYKPIPIKTDKNCLGLIGPTEVIYGTAGEVDYFRAPYEFIVNDKLEINNLSVKVYRYNKKYPAFYGDWESDEEDINDNRKLLDNYIGNIDTKTNTLRPNPLYIKDADPYCVIFYLGTEILWIQPILIMQNRYPSSTLNKWNGKEIEINYDNGTIVAPAIAAGKKNNDNTFSGVMIGDWSTTDTSDDIAEQTGVYGFHHGAMSFAFKEDGTAFIGKSGKGRIYFDGDHGEIYSGNYYIDEELKTKANKGMLIDLTAGHIDAYNFSLTSSSIYMDSATNTFEFDVAEGGHFAIEGSEKNLLYFSSANSYIQSNNFSSSSESGMKIDLDEGEITAYDFLLKAGSGSNKIIIDSEAEKYPLKIASDFQVSWDGLLDAAGAYLNSAYIKGEIVTDSGLIGGWKIGEKTLTGGTATNIQWDSDNRQFTYTWTDSEPLIQLDAANGAIVGGKLKASGTVLVDNTPKEYNMQLWGSLSVHDPTSGSLVTNKQNYFGALNSSFPGMEEKPGIGIYIDGIGALLVSEANTGLRFDSGGFLSISNTEANLSTTDFKTPIVIKGSNIELTSDSFKLKNISAENQEGIYARFA